MHPNLRPIVLAGLLACCAAPAAAIQVGDLAPDFALVDIHGTSHSLGALRGNVVLLAFIGYG